jgi:hypothetical protein
MRQLILRGQSAWLAFFSRDLVRSGWLACLIEEDGSLTSNSTIFEEAIGSGTDDDEIRAMARAGLDADHIFAGLATADATAACQVFMQSLAEGGMDADAAAAKLPADGVLSNQPFDAVVTVAEHRRLALAA